MKRHCANVHPRGNSSRVLGQLTFQPSIACLGKPPSRWADELTHAYKFQAASSEKAHQVSPPCRILIAMTVQPDHFSAVDSCRPGRKSRV